MQNDNIITVNEMLHLVCDNIEKAELERSNKLLKSWKFVVSSIKSSGINGENLGANLYSHSRVIDLKNEILLVECDHPGWIQTMRLYQKYILTGLKRGVPEAKITSLAFRLRGTTAELHNKISEEKIKADLRQKIDKEDAVLKEFEATTKTPPLVPTESEPALPKKELPKDLQEALNRLKSDLMESGE